MQPVFKAAAPLKIRIPDVPDLACLMAANPARYPYLFESAAHGPNARYDLLLISGGAPEDILRLDAGGMLFRGHQQINGDFLEHLKTSWRDAREHAEVVQDSDVPFTGGWFVYLAYELAHTIEPVLQSLPPLETGPVALAHRIRAAILIDRHAGEAWLVGERGTEVLCHAVQQDLLEPCPTDTDDQGWRFDAGMLLEEVAERFISAVTRIQRYITEGDVFQVNLSRAWRLEGVPLGPVALYRRLRAANPAPFAGLALLDNGHAIISSSPERLIEVREAHASTRPIAGTHPRGQSRDEDERLAQDLVMHPKERAEHIMLIDLERNDLGRVCEPGTVHVDELMSIETYAHVHHIVSEVSGRLRSDVDPVDVIRAVFPGGTITGCPKLRCMEIIGELEGEARGAYTGSMGYINHSGDMDLNILIRTIEQRGDCLHFRAGAGIVADSIPERELNETRAKAAGLVRALGSGS